MLFSISSVLSIPAQAASDGIYDPADYITDVFIEDGYKYVTFDFNGRVTPLTHFYPDGGSTSYFNGDFTYKVGTESSAFMRTFFLGQAGYSNKKMGSGVLYIGDIAPDGWLRLESTIEINISLGSLCSEPVSGNVSWGMFCYDKEGNFVKEQYQSLDSFEVTNPGGSYYIPISSPTTWEILPEGNNGSRITYVLPFLSISWNYLWAYTSGMSISCRVHGFSANVPIEEYNGDDPAMDLINDKLDLLISGGSAAGSLGSAGNHLEDASGSVSNQAGSLSSDIGSVSGFESGLMNDIESSFSKINISSDVGKFSTSLAFISGYAQSIFDGVNDWKIAITLPLFLGLFFGICQHVGGISNMRARHAREARNDELHQARLDKIKKGGGSS